MCDTAYHQEARRKARLLQRQQEFLKSASLAAQTPTNLSAVQTKPTPDCADPRKIQLDSGYRSSQYTRGLWGMDCNKPPKDSYGRLCKERDAGRQPQLHPHWPRWDKELRQHAKTLRNHFMYMGPNCAFAHLYEAPRRAQTPKLPSHEQQKWAYPGVYDPDIAREEDKITRKDDVIVWPLD